MITILTALSLLQQGDLESLLRELDARAAGEQERLSRMTGKDVRAAALISRAHAGTLDDKRAYTVATYSFEHATRDDLPRTRSDWDLEYGNGRGDRIDVRMVTDDLSLIWDLGAVDFDLLKLPKQVPQGRTSCEAVKGHVYVIHTEDTETDLWTKMQVLALESQRWIIFRWETFKVPSELERLERLPESLLRRATVRLQLRGGARGGNESRLFLHGKVAGSAVQVTGSPLPESGGVDSSEGVGAYSEGGFIPRGKVWIVRRIDVSGLAQGDTNGGGAIRVVAGGKTLLQHEGSKGFEPGVWTGRIVIRPGEERSVFVEIGNSSRIGAVFRGSLWDEKYADMDAIPKLSGDDMRRVDSLVLDLDSDDPERRASAHQSLARMGPSIRHYLDSIDQKEKSGEVKSRIRIILGQIDGE